MNTNLHKAKQAKNDEFYTRYEDIENELKHYTEHFRDKVVYCNCDNPEHSNFWKYFVDNFERLGLKKLIATYYNADGESYKWTYIGFGLGTQWKLNSNGDFRSQECIDILKEADVVVSNPPFSLIKEYISQLMEYNKKFLIIGGINCVKYKNIFPYIKDNKIWLGVNSKGGTRKGNTLCFTPLSTYESKSLIDLNGEKVQQISAWWITNIEFTQYHRDCLLDKLSQNSYYKNKNLYPKYIDYDAIEVSKTKNIPIDYYGIMGVPISFLTKYNPSEFEIIGLAGCPHLIKDGMPKSIYSRILIRRK